MVNRRRRGHRDPLGDKVCGAARRDAVVAALKGILDQAETDEHRMFFTRLLGAMTDPRHQSDIGALLVVLELAVSQGLDFPRAVDLTQWMTDAVRSATDPAQMLAWLYDDGTPAGQRCAVCGVLLPATGQRGRPRKYCGDLCKRKKAAQQSQKREVAPTRSLRTVDLAPLITNNMDVEAMKWLLGEELSKATELGEPGEGLASPARTYADERREFGARCWSMTGQQTG